MSLSLRNADAKAVDLLLDRAVSAQGKSNGGNGNGNGGATPFSATHASHAPVSNAHVAAVEKVLRLLNAMPADEPAPDLLKRTLARIDSATGAPLGRPSPTLIDTNRPVA